MKKFLAILLAMVMVLALVACGNQSSDNNPGGNATDTNTNSNTNTGTNTNTNTNTNDTSTAGGSVYWLNFKPESDAVLQEIAALYTDKTGVEVKVVTAASGTYSQTLTAEMDKSNPPTIFIVGNQAGVRDWEDYALDLTGTAIANELNTDAYNLYSDSGKLVSIGYSFEAFGIIVNPDLIEQAGHSMDEITDFAGLKAVAEDIHARASELGFDAFTSNDMDGSSSWRYTGHMINLEYVYEERAAGTVWTECPPSITGDYMENFKNLYDLAVENSLVDRASLATGGHDAGNEFKTGQAAFYVNGSWEWSAVSETVPNATMIPYYAGVAGEEKAGINCGTENCWAINAKASEADQQATMDFLVWLVTDPEGSALAVETFGAMPYKDAQKDNNGFLAAANNYAADGCYVMDWAFIYQPNTDEYRAAAVSALNQYNADPSDANWELVKTAFVQGWATQYAAVNG